MMRFIRWMILALAGFFVLSVFRLVMDAFKKSLMSESAAPAKGGGPVQPPATAGGELKKCAACGVYNTTVNSVTKVRSGETVYYCSTACQAKSAAA